MRAYLDLLQDILDNGVDKGDRTGTGTRSVFGRQMRFDLSKGFPLLTTKKMHMKSIIYELLWMMCGDTNIKYLNDNGVRIWNDWANQDGELGPVYGHAWRRFGAQPESIAQPSAMLPLEVEATYCGVANGAGSSTHPIGKVWQGMIQRCYAANDIGYANYGGRGVHVCNRWLEFSNFAEDYEKLPGWEASPGKRLTLDKDGVGDGFCYAPTHCQWITDEANALLKSHKVYTLEKGGKYFTFTNPSAFCREQSIPNNNISDLWTGRKNAQTRDGFSLVSVEDNNLGVDQLRNCLDTLRNNPNCRRNLVSAWHPYWIRYSALPPCHMMFQFYVANDRLSCQIYQRSCDFFLGVPFNIASYALLIHMMARMAGLKVGEFIWTGGDTHLYSNHFEQAREQLSREPKVLPTMLLKERGQDIDDWEFDDFNLINYDPHPGIKASVSV